MRITAACPEALIEDANHLAMILAFGPPDALTYGVPGWQDGAGNRYACASFPCLPSWFAAAQSALARPDWDADGIVDMDAAARAQAAIALQSPAAPDRLACWLDDDPQAALAGLGVVPMEADL